MTNRVPITCLRNYLASDLYRWLPPLLVISVLLLSMALPFVASPRQFTLVLFLALGVDLPALVVSMFFDGSKQKFLVYYNPKAEDHNLSVRIYGPCQQGEQVVTPGGYSAAPYIRR